MFLKNWIGRFMQNYLEQIKRVKLALEESNAILIGAGAVLSTAAGFDYTGEMFFKYFLLK